MQGEEPTPSKRTLRATHLTSRYSVDPRTIKRWKDTGVLPPPDLTINGIDYWFEATIERNERESPRPPQAADRDRRLVRRTEAPDEGEGIGGSQGASDSFGWHRDL